MSTDKLASIIEEAFEGRDKIGPKTRGAVRKAVNSALDSLDAGARRRAPGERSMACQSMAQEGRAAVVPPQ